MTAEELFALPPTDAKVDRWLFDGGRFDRWTGAGFHSPGHAAAVVNATAILAKWCHENGTHRAFGYGCPYLLARAPDTLVTFDASIVERSRCQHLRSDATHVVGPPVLAVEVAEQDEDPDGLARLIDASLRSSVSAVWIIDPVEEMVVVHRRRCAPEFLNGGMRVIGGDELPGFRCAVAEIFE
jgi:Uma2 family endonuclease